MNDNDPNLRVQYIAKENGQYVSRVADLIYHEGVPVLVESWHGSPPNQTPNRWKKLDPEQLDLFQSGEITHLYKVHVEFLHIVQ